MSSTEGFLEVCLERYESEMDSCFYSATSTAEFTKSHEKIKAEIVTQLPQKWSSIFRTTKMPSEYPDTLSKNIDSTFKQLKRHFEKSQVRDQNKLLALSAQQDAIQFYNEELEKYLRNRPSAAPKEIEMQHAKYLQQSISKACQKGGEAMTPEAISNLKKELEKRRKVYHDKAVMSLRTLQDPAIGIDLGTTMCCVMVFNKGKVEIIQNREEGNRNTTPSYVTYHEDGTNTFGMVAKEAAYRYPETTVYDAKRMVGRPWSDPNLQRDLKTWPFAVNVVEDDNQPKIRTWGKLRSPQEISARLLANFRVMAEKHLGLPQGSVRKAVITVPAYFTEPQRRATSVAAECAGFQVLNILSEPTAAAIAYTWEQTKSEKRKALIYDLGGGTFDVAIAEVSEEKVEILGVDGDTHLGGQDFDQLLMEYCVDEFKKANGVDLLASRREIPADKKKTMWSVTDDALSQLSRLKLECEKAKERLSTAESATVDVIGIHEGKNLIAKITRSKLNELVRPMVQTTIDIMARALNDVKSKGVNSKSDIDDVILVGGSTRMPLVLEMLKNYFDGKELCQNINPDEAVAYGAAVQAALLNKTENMKKIVVQDVTPMTLGIKLYDGSYSRMILKNSKIPCKVKKIYETPTDNQTSLRFCIYQGEDDMALKNKLLGIFFLRDIPPRPEGEKVHTTMTINSMGILQVEAEHTEGGTSNGITISADKLGMTEKEICELQTEIRGMKIK